MLKRLLEKDPAFRISALEIFNHFFLKNNLMLESFMKVPEENEVLASDIMKKFNEGYLY